MAERAAMEGFLADNNVQEVDASDEIFRFDEDKHREETNLEPWIADPTHFKKTKISAVAVLKMVTHALSGGRLEVMGILQGKVEGDTMIVVDCFAIPVKGTETQVNASDAESAFMAQHSMLVRQVGRLENVLGWYHSHPGYGCWLSGTDVATQLTNQQHQDPWLAVVVDPIRTQVSGKVELGAFRCYPKGREPPRTGEDAAYQHIPMEKIEDFGVHANAYYELEVSYFRSSLDSRIMDSLWHQYWVNTLSSSSVTANEDYTTQQIADVSRKLSSHASKSASTMRAFGAGGKTESEFESLNKIAMDGAKAAMEMSGGLATEVMKTKLFSGSFL